jgi:hypothetical protein
MQEQFVADTHVVCGHYNGQSIGDECDMTHKSLIENGVNQLAIIAAAFRFTADFGSIRGSKVAHAGRLAGAHGSRQVPIWSTELTFIGNRVG